MVRRMMIFFIVFLVGLVLLHTSLLVVYTHQYVVLYRSNTIQRIITQPGLYLKWPAFLQQVRVLDKRVLTSAGETAQHPLATSDQHKLMATWYVQWKITDPTRYAPQFGYRDTVVKETLHETIRSALHTQVQQHRASHWLGIARASLDKHLQQQVQRIAQQQKWGLQVEAIHIMRLDISPAQAQQAQTAMVQAIRNSQQQLQTNMQHKLDQIKTTAAQQHQHIIDKAHQDATRIRAQGDAAAMQIYAKNYAQNPDLAKYLQNLSLYQNTLHAQQDVLVLNPNKNGLFSQLHHNKSTPAVADSPQPLTEKE